jgi:hypothetical protein
MRQLALMPTLLGLALARDVSGTPITFDVFGTATIVNGSGRTRNGSDRFLWVRQRPRGEHLALERARAFAPVETRGGPPVPGYSRGH